VILATLAGLALQHWARWENAALGGFFVGVVLAMFVPARSRTCRID
jgi:hypothetical protein